MVGGLVSFASFPSSSLPRQALPWLTQGNSSKEPVFLFLGPQIQDPLTHCQGQLYCFALLGCRACSPVCDSWWRAGLVLSLSLPWDQLSCLPQVSRDGKWRTSFPHPWHCKADEGSGLGTALFLSYPHGVRQIVSALVCCPGRK